MRGARGSVQNRAIAYVRLDGSGLEQVTTDEGFDGFPMFSPDGKKLIWASQRVDPKSQDVNLFIADFKP